MTIDKPIAYIAVFACLALTVWSGIVAFEIFQTNLQLRLDDYTSSHGRRMFCARFLYSIDPGLLYAHPEWKAAARGELASEILDKKRIEGDEETTKEEVIERLIQLEAKGGVSENIGGSSAGLLLLILLLGIAGMHFLSDFVVDPSWRVLEIREPAQVFSIGFGILALIGFVFAGFLEIAVPAGSAVGWLAVAAFQLILLMLVAQHVNSTGASFLQEMGLKGMDLGQAVKIGAAAYLVFLPIQVILSPQAEILSYFLGRQLEMHPAMEEFIETTSVGVKAGIALQAVIFAPLIEELYFRGVFLNSLNRYLLRSVACLVCGLVFGLLHGSFVSVFLITFLGIHLCYLRQKTGSLVPCIVVHFLFNAFAIIQVMFTG